MQREIETGRWSGIARNGRTCLLCYSDEIGDELHYVVFLKFVQIIIQKLQYKDLNIYL